MHAVAEKYGAQRSFFTIACVVAALGSISASSFWLLSMWRLRSPSPYADDFDCCINFLSDWVETKRWQLLFEVHNEHSQLLLRLLVLLGYALTGSVSFDFLTACSITSPILFCLLLGSYLCYRLKVSWKTIGLWILPCVLLTSQPGAWGSYLWITSGLIHGYMPFLALGTFFAFESRRFALSIFLAAFSFFCGGSGIFVAAILSGFFVYHYGRNYRFFLSIAIVCAFGLGLFFLTQNPLLLKNLQAFQGSNRPLLGLIEYALAFLGNAFHFSQPMLGICAGIVFIVLFFLARPFSTPALFGLALMTVCAAASSAVLRYPGGGLAHALLSRYEVYSTALWSALYALYIIKFWSKRFFILSMAIAISGYISVLNYETVPPTISAHQLTQNRDFVMARFDPQIVLGEYPPRVATDRILDRAEKLGIFQSNPTQFFDRFIEKDVALPHNGAPVLYGLDLFETDSEFMALRGWSVINASELVAPRKVCLIVASLESDAKNFRLCVPQERYTSNLPTSPERLMTLAKVENLGFSLIFPKAIIASGTYKIGLMDLGKKDWHLVWLPQTISSNSS